MEHWTAESTEHFLYRIGSDFIEQLRSAMKVSRMTQSQLANLSGVSAGRISQLFRNPGNLTLDTIIKLSRAAGMKVSVVAYDDGDAGNERGPINSEVFERCWREAGKPQDFWHWHRDPNPASAGRGDTADS